LISWLPTVPQPCPRTRGRPGGSWWSTAQFGERYQAGQGGRRPEPYAALPMASARRWSGDSPGGVTGSSPAMT